MEMRGLGSQGMHTTGYTYHLKEGKRDQRRGGPRSRGRREEGVIEPQATQRAQACDGTASQPGSPTFYFTNCLGVGLGDETAS